MKYYMFNGMNEGSKNTSPKKELNKGKVIKVIIFIVFILLVCTFIILYTKNDKCRKIFDKYIFRKEVYEDNLPFIEVESSKNINICAYDKYVALLDQNLLKLYNKSAKEEHSLDVDISNPIFEVNNSYLCVAEKNGQKVYLINGKNIVWQKEIEGNINSINVNENGYVSLITSGTSYKTVVYTLDPNGNELFKKYLSTANVIDTDISKDNKYLAIAEANFSGIVVQSTIEIISIEDAKNKYSHTAEPNDLIINIKYNNKNELICMYDEHIDMFKEGQSTQLLRIKEQNILFADINLSSEIIKITKKSTGPFNAEAEMQIINSSTNKTVNYNLENIPRKVYAQGNMIAIDLGTNILFINNGRLVSKKISVITRNTKDCILR